MNGQKDGDERQSEPLLFPEFGQADALQGQQPTEETPPQRSDGDDGQGELFADPFAQRVLHDFSN